MRDMNLPQNIIELIETLKQKGVPEKEYQKYVLKFLEVKTRLGRVPMHGTFELTPLCNLDCKMCYVHLSHSQFEGQKLLPVAYWKDLMKQAHEKGMLTAALTGGECLTYPDFDDLYLFLIEMGVRITIMTNGILLNDSRILFFKQHKPKGIQVTLYGGSDDEYEEVTGHRVFRAVFQNIMMLRDAQLPFSVSITPNPFLYNNIKNLLEKLEEYHIPYVINSSLLPPRKNTGRESYDLTNEQYIEISRIRRELKGRIPVPVDPCELPDVNRIAKDASRYGLKCSAGRNAFTILYDGNMCPCVGLNEIITEPLVVGFLEAWKQLTIKADEYLMPSECEDCVYQRECLLCPAMHKEAPPGHCNTRICERTKQLVAGGYIPIPKIS